MHFSDEDKRRDFAADARLNFCRTAMEFLCLFFECASVTFCPMKNTLLTFSFFLLSAFLYGQEAEDILKQTFEKCQSVQNGTYSMTRHMKYMSAPDTTIQRYTCVFKKIAFRHCFLFGLQL